MGTLMTTNLTSNVVQPATSGGAVMRERFVFGSATCAAPVQVQVKGTSVPAVGDLSRTFVKHNPAAIKDGAASGLPSWRHPV